MTVINEEAALLNLADRQMIDEAARGPADTSSERIEELPNGRKLHIGHDPDPEPSPAKLVFGVGLNAVREFMTTRAELERDQRFSPYGRAEKLEPVQAKAATVIANGWHSLDCIERDIAKSEEAFYAVPEVDPQNAADAIRDREIRDYVRSLNVDERGKLLAELNKGGHEQIVLALMRSPIPLGVSEIVAKGAWRATKEAADPAFLESLATMKASNEWGRKALAHLAGSFLADARLNKEQVFAAIADKEGNAKGFAAFGISAEYVKQMKNRIADGVVPWAKK